MIKAIKSKKGFTLAELLISISILGLISVLTFSIYINLFDSFQNIKAANLVYEEARLLMEKIVREVRNGTIDYEEYFNQSHLRNQFPENYSYLRNEIYGQDYCQYSRQFYTLGVDNEIGTPDDQSTGIRSAVDPVDGLTPTPPAIGEVDELNNDIATPIQKDLFLINLAGDQRTYIKRTEETDSLGNVIGKIAMLKLIGEDFGVDHINAYNPNLNGTGLNCSEDLGEGDGYIDTWLCADGFPCQEESVINAELCTGVVHEIIYDPNDPGQNSFVDISPSSLDIQDLTFFVSPMDDPRKAYNNNEVQIQPHITIKLTVQAAPLLDAKYEKGYRPSITLESTVSARVYSEILSECNVKQCTPGVSPNRDCPLTEGVCGPNAGSDTAQQICTDYIWPGCTVNDYQDHADNEWGTDSFFSPERSYFENGLEYQSCNQDLATCLLSAGADPDAIEICNLEADNCKAHRCSDGLDNDCSGRADSDDNACNIFLCNDGIYDAAVEGFDGCIDVGGACQNFRTKQTNESLCNDGHDNDCDGYADQFDSDCVNQICSNGVMDSGTIATYLDPPFNLFFTSNSVTQDYLLDETSPQNDPTLNEVAADIGGICELCFDNSGNGACSCGGTGCTSDPILNNQNFEPGGETFCFDGLDNDADGGIDWADVDGDCCSATPYCLQSDSLTFIDFLESNDYLQTIESMLEHNLSSGEISLNVPNTVDVRVISGMIPLDVASCATNYNVNLSGTVLDESNGSIRFYLSDDGGTTWCGDLDCVTDSIDSSELGSEITFSGSDLRWRAVFTSNAIGGPNLEEVHLNFSCN